MIDLYAEGASNDALSTSDTMGTDVGFVRYSIPDVRQKMREVQALMIFTNEDFAKARTAKKTTHEMYRAWVATWVAWSKFYDDFQGLRGVWMLHRDRTWETAEEYRRKALGFRGTLAKIKAPVTPVKKIIEHVRALERAPGVSLNPRNAPVDGWPWWKWALLGTGGAVIGYGVYRVLRPSVPHVPVLNPAPEEVAA